MNVNIKQQGTHLAQCKPLHQSSAVAHVKVYWSREAPFCNDGCMTTVLVREMHDTQALNGACGDCFLTLYCDGNISPHPDPRTGTECCCNGVVAQAEAVQNKLQANFGGSWLFHLARA